MESVGGATFFAIAVGVNMELLVALAVALGTTEKTDSLVVPERERQREREMDESVDEKLANRTQESKEEEIAVDRRRNESNSGHCMIVGINMQTTKGQRWVGIFVMFSLKDNEKKAAMHGSTPNQPRPSCGSSTNPAPRPAGRFGTLPDSEEPKATFA